MKVLGENLHVGEDWHEVRVARPAGHDVEVNMVDDAGARNSAEVPAEVVALRPVGLGESRDPALSKAVDLESLIVRKVGELADVPVGGDHQVAGGVRELVQQHKGVLAAMDDEPLLVVTDRSVAEDAARLLVGLGDVFEPPGSPELLRHGREITFCPQGL